MIYDVWSYTFPLDKQLAAQDFNHRVNKYHKDQDLVLKVRTLDSINGHTSKIIHVYEFESLATMAVYWGGFWKNGWAQFAEDWDGTWVVPGTFERYQYNVLEY